MYVAVVSSGVFMRHRLPGSPGQPNGSIVILKEASMKKGKDVPRVMYVFLHAVISAVLYAPHFSVLSKRKLKLLNGNGCQRADEK